MRLVISAALASAMLPVVLGGFWLERQVASSTYFTAQASTNVTATSRWGSSYMPNLPVLDQDGHAYAFYDDLIKNKKVIINFIYTSCSSICPLTTSRMALLQQRLGEAVGRDYFMYSISIDPFHDGPAELKRYAEAFNVKPGWKFLTGKPEDIELIRNKLGERSKVLADHKQEVLLGDDANGSWSHDSVLGDLDGLVFSVHSMDGSSPLSGTTQSGGGLQTVELAPGQALYSRMCTSCHSIGGNARVGPDLKDVTQRRTHSWLESFISSPDKMFAQQDPTAMSLLHDYPGVRMPNLGLTPTDARDVIAYIETTSGQLANAAAH